MSTPTCKSAGLLVTLGGCTYLHVQHSTTVVYAWDGKPSSHPLRLFREGLGWTKAMRLATAAGIDRLDINAIEKGKNKGSSARVVLNLARVLYLTPYELFDLLQFKLRPEDALTLAEGRRLAESLKSATETRALPMHEIRPEPTPAEKRAERKRSLIRRGSKRRREGAAAAETAAVVAAPAHRRAAG